MAEYPYATRPVDVTRLLKLIPTMQAPAGKVDASYIKSLGFTPASSDRLLDILKALGFLNERNEATEIWKTYSVDESRGLVLASAIKSAYANLFKMVFCPYLESDDVILDFFEREGIKRSSKDKSLMLETFRHLSELADFQDIMCEEGTSPSTSHAEQGNTPNIKVNPNLQLNLEIHIAADTPEEKIESIFKNMRKYLLDQEG